MISVCSGLDFAIKNSRSIAPLLLMGTFVFGLTVARANEAVTSPKDLMLFLLVGQSNMAGRATIEPEDRQPISDVWMLDVEANWVPATDPMHFDKPKIVGVGPARSFVEMLRRARPGCRIGLIPCAVGGTSLQKWSLGEELFSSAIVRTRKAMLSGRLAGILWHQGESDIHRSETATSYAERLQVVLTAFRDELEAERVPIILGAIGEFLYASPGAKGENAREVNRQIASLANDGNLVGFISSEGLDDRGDRLHFSRQSQEELGLRYTREFLRLDALRAEVR